MNRQVAAFRRLLRVYPAAFRAEYADEMTRLFAEQLDDASTSERRSAIARLWVTTLVDLAVTAPGHHIRREERVPRPVDLGAASSFVTRGVPGPGPRILLGLLPLWGFGFLVLAAPGSVDPLFSNPPAILGLPAGVVLALGALVWMLVGVVLIRQASTFIAVTIALVAFTAPAGFALILIPAAILAIQGLAA